MAVYNIFASADATIYSRYLAKNTGRDPILEVSAKNSQDGTRFLFRDSLTENPYYTYDLAANGNYSTTDAYFPDSDIRRALLQFSPADINKIYTLASQSSVPATSATASISSSYQDGAFFKLTGSIVGTFFVTSSTVQTDAAPIYYVVTGSTANLTMVAIASKINTLTAFNITASVSASNLLMSASVAGATGNSFSYASASIAQIFGGGADATIAPWQANLKMFLASAQNLSTTYSLDAFAVSQSWVMGTGQYAQVPESRNGVSWTYTGPYQNSPAWADTGSSYDTNYTASQFFDYMSNKDIDMNVSDIVNGWFSSSLNSGGISNYGIVVKHPDYIEENTSSFVDLKFFSVDTHTIYPPTIEFKWDDSYYYPSAGATNYVLNDQITITLANNPGQFRRNQVYKVRTAVRYTYPPRSFATQSTYLNPLYLSENSYWALQDVKTEEMVVNFDPDFTKLSADSVGNYFTLYTSGLEVNRFYRLLIKTSIYSTTYGPLSLYDNEQAIYNALSLYGAADLALLPAEEVIYSGQNLIFKIIE